MSGKKILYILHPSLSHVNASKKLLKILSDQNFEIILCTNSIGRSYVKDLPYQIIFVDSMPFASGFEEQMQLGTENGRYFETLLLKKSRHFYRHRSNAFGHILDKIRPDVLLVDILYSTDIIFLYKWSLENDCALAYVRTKVNPLFDHNTPPMNFAYSGKNRLNNLLLWNLFFASKWLRDIFNFFKYQGYNDRSVLQKSLAHTENLKAQLCWYRCVGSQFKNIPELVLLPREFELPNFLPRPLSKYVGFQYTSPEAAMELQGELKEIIQNCLSNDHKIIYISFGSLYDQYREKIKRLLQNIMAILKEQERTTCILSLKDARSFIELPDNVHAFDFVDQFALLKHANLFITHGGINSIKEALIQGVPMLVYPLNLNWDQPGNSARIQRLGLGLKGCIYRDSTKIIRKKIDQLLNNNSYIENINKFKKTEESYTREVVHAAFMKIRQLDTPVKEPVTTFS